MKIIGIIPARYASTRFPGKPLIDIKDKTMIQRVYEQAAQSNLSEVWVATDDERIKSEVLSWGGKVLMTPESIPNGSERCRFAFKEIGKDADGFINVQGDEPLIHPESINQVIGLLEKDEVQIATLIRTETDEDEIVDPNRVKVVIDRMGRALLFSRSVIPFPRKKPEDLVRYVHIGIYGFKGEVISKLEQLETSPEEKAEQLEQLTWRINGFDIHTAVSEHAGVSIDSPQDYDYLIANWDYLNSLL